MDYLDCIVHILSPEARNFYQLERLWNDGVRVEPKVLTA
jgi:ribosomal silencing factor RsfS